MPHKNILKGATDDDIWRQVTDQLNSKEEALEYTALLSVDGYEIMLDVDTDPGGGFEGGYASTTYTARLQDDSTYRFLIQKQGFKEEIGKLFGMQDIVIGAPEFDKRFIVKTTDPEKTKSVFSDKELQRSLLHFPEVTFEIRDHKLGGNYEVMLDLHIEEAITEPERLKEIYSVFKKVLHLLDPLKSK